MGWISKRFMQRGRSKMGRTISEEKRKAPLRKIVGIIQHRDGLFDSDYVQLECGHKTYAYGALRARCTDCSSE